MPKPSGKMNERERAICSRLKSFREGLRYPLEEFAESVGTSSHKLAGIEYGRTPVRYEVFKAVTNRYNLNPSWLAAERGSHLLFEPFDDSSFASQLKPRALFTEVWDAHLAKDSEIGSDKAHKLMNEVMTAMRRAVLFVQDETIPKSLRKKVAATIIGPSETVTRKLKLAEKLYLPIPESQPQKWNQDNLDTEKASAIVEGMSAKNVPTWSQLKKTIVRLTAGHGQKAALANELGVSRQVLGNWLADGEQGAPNAELTLWLFKWSLDTKRRANDPKQKKRPGKRVNARRSKTSE